MIKTNIQPLKKDLVPEIMRKINTKTKPLGSLGRLEEIALKIAQIQDTLEPLLKNPSILIFAGDHGIAEEGVSCFPQEVTYQMVFNFLNGGAAINVFSNQHQIDLKVIDAGVKHNFNHNMINHHRFIQAKIGMGTRNFLKEKAMTTDDCLKAMQRGMEIVQDIQKSGCNIMGFGEMGIANTSSAAVIINKICNLPLEQCVGRGTGLDDQGVKNKLGILKTAIETHKDIPNDPISILSTFGGFEIAMMVGAMLKAGELKMTLLIDGFICTSAFLAAYHLDKTLIEYSLFSHCSDEGGHKFALDYLQVKPLLNLGMRLGEGSGVAVAYPIVQSAVRFLNEMASFESAQVSENAQK